MPGTEEKIEKIEKRSEFLKRIQMKRLTVRGSLMGGPEGVVLDLEDRYAWCRLVPVFVSAFTSRLLTPLTKQSFSFSFLFISQ